MYQFSAILSKFVYQTSIIKTEIYSVAQKNKPYGFSTNRTECRNIASFVDFVKP